tara:strand:- start:447 stop:638 length:192 start_codon:yes stop_codon:yes gene_type:complete
MNQINHNIKLTEQEMEVCNASPLEMLNYFFFYPNELFSQATQAGLDVKDYINSLLFQVSEQLN